MDFGVKDQVLEAASPRYKNSYNLYLLYIFIFNLNLIHCEQLVLLYQSP